MAVYLRTVQEVQAGIAGRFKARRLAMNLSRKDLAARLGRDLRSLKRFEREGLIALDSLLNLALVLNCLDDFDKPAVESRPISATEFLDALLATPALRTERREEKTEPWHSRTELLRSIWMREGAPQVGRLPFKDRRSFSSTRLLHCFGHPDFAHQTSLRPVYPLLTPQFRWPVSAIQ